METKITQQELAALLALATGKQKTLCDDFLRTLMRVLTEELEKGENIRIKGFGTFKLIDIEARKSVNVATGGEYEIPEHKRVIFVAGKELAALVNAPFEAFEAVEVADGVSVDSLEGDTVPEVLSKNEEPSPVAVSSQVEPEAIPTVNETAAIPAPEENEEQVPESMPVINSDYNSEPQSATLPEAAYEDDEEEEARPRFRFAKGFLVGFIVALVLVGVAVLIGYYSGWFPNPGGVAKVEQKEQEKIALSTIKNDSIQTEKPIQGETDSVDLVPTQPSDMPVETKKEEETKPVYDTVSTTRYLTTIAQEHYGNFNLWPIIYEENKAILGHPDRIKPGTRVVVPPLSKYGIDPDNEAQLREVKQKGVAIYASFKKGGQKRR
ncbi:MAG: HU family DNA-binding protein [Muribaculaceae bacterium]|nr:HU family DNA-binding protein [Muribaculaceae bacterium]